MILPDWSITIYRTSGSPGVATSEKDRSRVVPVVSSASKDLKVSLIFLAISSSDSNEYIPVGKDKKQICTQSGRTWGA